MSGEPTTFSQELFDDICAKIAEGASLRSICRADDMPNTGNVYVWLKGSPDLQDQYARAREDQADTLFDDCLSIADQYEAEAENLPGGTDHIQRAKLRIDTRKWMAGKLRPKKYGERLAIGGDKDMDPIETREVGAGAKKLTALIDQLAERGAEE